MAARDTPVSAETQPYQDVAAEAFDHRHAFALFARARQRRLRLARGQALEDSLDQCQTVRHFVDADPDARIHIAIGAGDGLEAELAVRQCRRQLARIEGAARSTADRDTSAGLP